MKNTGSFIGSRDLKDIEKAAAVFLVLFLSGCDFFLNSPEEIEAFINENLGPNSSRDEIVEFFESQDWLYSYQVHSDRFRAFDPEQHSLPLIVGRNQIYVYIDLQGNFVRAEVVRVHTWL